jgi:tripartite-type tricarboxylate transporter receptor subunit TctC
MLSRRRFVTVAAAGAGIAAHPLLLARRATAQTVAKPARMLVGLAAGGGVDAVARLLVEHVKGYAQSLIVENRTGAGGRIMLEVLKSAEADGSVMGIIPADQLSLYTHIYRRLGYRPEDFAPVAVVCSFQFVLAIGPRVPAEVRSLADFVAWCRANPSAASVGTAGVGSLPHFLGLTLAKAAGFEFVHVPYKGAGPAIQDMLGSHVAAVISNVGSLQPHVQSGSLRALATIGPRRSAAFAGVPAIGEAGYPALASIGVERLGVIVPARTPADTVAALNKSVREALAADTVKAGLVRLGFEPAETSPQEFAQIIASDTQRWAEVVKSTGFKAIE